MRPSLLDTLAAAPLFLAASLPAQLSAQSSAQLPVPPGAHVVTVSPPEHRGSEPGIAIDTRDPRHIVAVYQPAHAAYSTDSARTFTVAEGTTPSDWRVAGDVSVAFDDKGNAYLSYLTFDKLGTTSYWAHGAGRNGIYVRRSSDGGKTWDKDALPVKVWYTGNEPNLQYEDMPRIFSDVSPKSPHRGAIYEGWIEWQIDKSIMLFSRSTDQGKTWSTPIRISTQPGLPRDDNGALVGFVGTVDADGTIYAIWNDQEGIAFTTSKDGGKSFAPSRTIRKTPPPYFGLVPGVSRVMGFPQVGVDWKSGKLYVTWSDYHNGDIDVFLISSADHGRTWSEPLRVNDDPLHDGRDQFFQFLAVDPLRGDVYVQFYDRRDDPQNRKTRMTLARSTDGGRTFTNYAWTDTPFEGQSLFLGDYTWLAAWDGRVYGVWAEAAPQMSGADSSAQSRMRGATVIRVGTADFRK